MKMTFITPHVGVKNDNEYVRTWQMEPLPIATLASLTPSDVEVNYFDERLERINFDEQTDVVSIAVETYTAKRAYEIASEYHSRGVKTILGGYHVTLMPDEAEMYADSIVVGFAEPLWKQLISDAEKGILKRRYIQNRAEPYEFVMPKREIFGTRPYFKVSCIETGRGCPLHCNFCSIAAVTASTYLARPIDSVIEEVSTLKNRNVFFVEDNFVGNVRHAKELCRRLIPQKIRWFGQGTLNIAKDEELLELMAESGCLGVLIGFESLRNDTLSQMDKNINVKMGDYKKLIKIIHSYGIALYGTFVFGYDTESAEDVMKTVEAAIDFGIFLGAFNHLVPFPGTPLYKQFQKDGRLTDEAWWLSPTFRFGDITFNPTQITAKELHAECIKARRKFYSLPSIVKRARNISGNCCSVKKTAAYFYANGLLRKEIDQKDGLPLGDMPKRPVPIYKGGVSL